MFVSINGATHSLWRAVDHEGNVRDILVQRRRDKGAARKFFRVENAIGPALSPDGQHLAFIRLPVMPDAALVAPRVAWDPDDGDVIAYMGGRPHGPGTNHRTGTPPGQAGNL